MKYFILFSLLFPARYVTAQELLGFVGGWKMDNSCQLVDISNNSPAAGALIDVSLTTNRGNAPQSALLFNQSTSYVALGAVSKLKLANDKSIAFWIKPVPAGSNHTGSIFYYGSGFNISYQEQGANLRLIAIFGNSYITRNLTANQWQFVTVTFQKDFSSTRSKAFLYIDGAFITDGDQPKTTASFFNQIALIGPQDMNTLTNGFRGSLDELRIYDRTLTATEVQNLALPVTLEYFRGKRSGASTELSWKTQVEDNVSHFELQKSTDGVSFQSILNISAGKYQYVASDVPDNYMTWYRLKVVDIDGKITYSNVIRVSGNESEAGGIKIFPNPVAAKLQLVGASGYGKVTVINSLGMVVKQSQFSSGNMLDVSALPPGLYQVIFFDGTKRMNARFTKL